MRTMSRSQRMRRKKLRTKVKAIPVTRFCLDVDFYDAGDTWRLTHPYTYQTNIFGYNAVSPSGVRIDERGKLFLPKDFAFDGSGPTIDTEDATRGVAIHDGLYHLHQYRLIPSDRRKDVDNMFFLILREDGMHPLRADIWHTGVRMGGWYAWNKKGV